MLKKNAKVELKNVSTLTSTSVTDFFTVRDILFNIFEA